MKDRHFLVHYCESIYEIEDTWVISDREPGEQDILEIIKNYERKVKGCTLDQNKSNAVARYYTMTSEFLGYEIRYTVKVTELYPVSLINSAPVE